MCKCHLTPVDLRVLHDRIINAINLVDGTSLNKLLEYVEYCLVVCCITRSKAPLAVNRRLLANCCYIPVHSVKINFQCEISSYHGGEYEVKNCLLVCTAM
jgi:hypothetical protein